MKLLPALLLLLLASINQAQTVILSPKRVHYLDLGFRTPLTVLVEGVPCSAYILTTDNGEIHRSEEDDADFYITPSATGIARLSLSVVKRRDTTLVGEFKLMVKRADLKVSFGGRSGGKVDRAFFEGKIHTPLYMTYRDYLFEGISLEITNYSMMVLRGDSALFIKHIEEERLPMEFICLIPDLSSGDEVIFYQFTCKGPEGVREENMLLRFIIK